MIEDDDVDPVQQHRDNGQRVWTGVCDVRQPVQPTTHFVQGK
ncbi:hypothetical protein ACWEKT_15365 [Nocardia takedensis]